MGFIDFFENTLLNRRSENINRQFSGNLLRYLLQSAEANDIMSKYKSILNIVQNLTYAEWKTHGENALEMYMKKIQSCENKAYMSWTKDIREGELQLKTHLRKEKVISEEQVNRMVSTSKESIVPTRKGWTLNNVVLPIKSVLFKMEKA